MKRILASFLLNRGVNVVETSVRDSSVMLGMTRKTAVDFQLLARRLWATHPSLVADGSPL